MAIGKYVLCADRGGPPAHFLLQPRIVHLSEHARHVGVNISGNRLYSAKFLIAGIRILLQSSKADTFRQTST